MKIIGILIISVLLLSTSIAKPKKKKVCSEIQSFCLYNYFKDDNIVDDRKCFGKIFSLSQDSLVQKIIINDSITTLLNNSICQAEQTKRKYYRNDSKNIYGEIMDINKSKHLIVITSSLVFTDYATLKNYHCENSVVLRNLFEKYSKEFKN
jgi:hypothetical protein